MFIPVLADGDGVTITVVEGDGEFLVRVPIG